MELKLIFIFIIFTNLTLSQNRFNISVSQIYSDDWQTGKMHSLEICSSSDFRLKYKIDTLDLLINLRYSIGVAYDKPSDSLKAYARPTDNDLFGEFTLKYPVGWKLDPYISTSAQTQIMEAFKYIRGDQVRTSNFRDPITTIQSLGFAWGIGKGKELLNSRIGISLKRKYAQIITIK